MSRRDRNDKFPKWGGRVPTSSNPVRSRAVILRCLDPQLTPIQLQTEVETDQLAVKIFLGLWITLSFKARRAVWSVSMVVGLTEKVATQKWKMMRRSKLKKMLPICSLRFETLEMEFVKLPTNAQVIYVIGQAFFI
ncbi:hypothetical protein V6N12_045783 [Hibiscus sabdariffa]|uniref:Uncharacterized protein n=1 Tax=Hibiscus sabdariffa TaxID=183260 RepID=A0ABR2G478_9ROSI